MSATGYPIISPPAASDIRSHWRLEGKASAYEARVADHNSLWKSVPSEDARKPALFEEACICYMLHVILHAARPVRTDEIEHELAKRYGADMLDHFHDQFMHACSVVTAFICGEDA